MYLCYISNITIYRNYIKHYNIKITSYTCIFLRIRSMYRGLVAETIILIPGGQLLGNHESVSIVTAVDSVNLSMSSNMITSGRFSA